MGEIQVEVVVEEARQNEPAGSVDRRAAALPRGWPLPTDGGDAAVIADRDVRQALSIAQPRVCDGFNVHHDRRHPFQIGRRTGAHGLRGPPVRNYMPPLIRYKPVLVADALGGEPSFRLE
jgi:hypothetical protein